MADEALIAVFVDYENLAIGVRDAKGARLDLGLVLTRLLQKGRLVCKRAYCDWSPYRREMRDLHMQGIEMVDIPQSKTSGKNSADIHMVVDAMDLCYSKEHIGVFVLLSGDSDFSPLVSKLKENDKRVIGCGVRNSTSDLLVANCDEFIYYDDLSNEQQRQRQRSIPKKGSKPDSKDAARQMLVDIVTSLEGDYHPLWGSMVKQALQRVRPGFTESQYGYRSFTEMLRDAESQGLIALQYVEERGNFKVRLPES